jgi:L-seryl-tRNA(Ser) seleniumtransferase
MTRPDESVVHGSQASLPASLPTPIRPDPARAQDLPAVDRLLRSPAVKVMVAEHGHTLVAAEARALLDRLRTRALAGTLGRAEVAEPALVQAVDAAVKSRLAPRLRRVLNLTGTVIHTNLGSTCWRRWPAPTTWSTT